jgi:hypothetical protein
MKVKLYQRQVYYKVGVIEIEIPNLEESDFSEVHQYLMDHEDLWIDKLAENMDDCPLTNGFGMDDMASWSDTTEETEYLYELPNGNGGHI